jgi:tetratricopeptide (TPR) repeat protein
LAESVSEASEAEILALEKRHRRRMSSMLAFLAILALPVALGIWRLARVHLNLRAQEAWAVAELAKPAPDPAAYGALGSLRLDQGRLEEALPLLEKAVLIEAKAGQDTRDTLTLAKAHLRGLARGLAGASKAQAETALRAAEARAAKLPQGRAAATYFSAGMFWKEAGEPALSSAALKKAMDLQPDDWVDEGGGVRYKQRGLASYYQKMYDASLMR